MEDTQGSCYVQDRVCAAPVRWGRRTKGCTCSWVYVCMPLLLAHRALTQKCARAPGESWLLCRASVLTQAHTPDVGVGVGGSPAPPQDRGQTLSHPPAQPGDRPGLG